MSPTSSGTKGNKCQYWVKEPEVCGNWDDTVVICTEPEADYYPFCNLIGTQTKCSKYDGNKNELTWRCVRPDPNRTIKNRRGKDWVKFPIIENGKVKESGNYDGITGYNDGKCDGKGTNIKCSGYMPFHMGFSELQPDDLKSTLGYDKDGGFTTLSGLTFRLPLNFEIYNLRAQLSRCHWWKHDTVEFSVSSSGTIEDINFYCVNPDEITNEYSKFNYNNDLNMYTPPCNGAKPECPYYTGVCWEYCIDEYMKHGDYVLAEQIMELRYYLRRDKWTYDYYEESFYEPVLYAWEGALSLDVSNIHNSLIPAIKVEFETFDYFKLNRESVTLGVGLHADDHMPQYPTLVRELNKINLSPIIRNKFDVVDNHYVFETSDLDHAVNLIFGDIFYYDSKTYAFNLNDPKLDIPSDIKSKLLAYNSLDDIEAAIGSDLFDEFCTKFDNLIAYFIEYFSEHIPESYVDSSTGMFFINTPTFWGDNTIIVINNGNGWWEFDKISFKKEFVGGIIGQLSFTVYGDGVINYLPSYETGFRVDKNNNGVITFKFFPLTRGTKEHNIYIDGVKNRLSPNYLDQTKEYFKLNYKLYKRKLFSNLELSINEHVKFFGNAGYALVIIPDENYELIDLFKHWEAENIKLVYSEDDSIEMEIFLQDSSKLELNQLIIKPKKIEDFSMPCKDTAKVVIESIYVYERYTGATLEDDYEEIKEFFISNDAVVEYSDIQVEKTGDVYSVSKFDDVTIAPSIIFKGRTGRIKGQAKTKLITWVRQPFCRDVEIFYRWEAKYQKYKLLPEFKKYGPTGVEVYIDLQTVSYTPPCGDHDLSFVTQLGPLWYPYSSCDDMAYYNINSSILGVDNGIMEVFLKEYGADPPHGQHDIRMLGPADNFGEICGIHSTLWNCSEDWSYCNLEKVGNNYFIGYARYRGGLSYTDKLRALQNGGSLPKFGNTYRDFLRSFRSVDNIDYYYWNGSSYVRYNKWVPHCELYSIVDYTSIFRDYPYKMYMSNDFYDDKSLFLDQMGMLLMDNVEEVNINETVVADENGLIRFDFDDIFRVHDITGIYYPEPVVLYVKGQNLTPIISWYTYKDNPLGDLDKSIQWAWREPWKELERGKIEGRPNEIDFYNWNGHNVYFDDNTLNDLMSSLYTNTPSGICGIHKFLSINYPEYKYDFRLKEHRLVCDEGNHQIKLFSPPSSGSLSDAVWKLQLNDGPVRCFNLSGEWVTHSGCNDNLYSTCTKPPWVSDITIFDTGYDSTTPDTERTIITYDDLGNEVKTYYHRGLNIQIDKNVLNKYLPYKYNLMDIGKYELRLSKKPIKDADGSWVTLEDLDNYYPGITYLGLIFEHEQEFVSIDIKPNCKTGIFAIGIDYTYGSKHYEEADNEYWDFYSIPGIIVYKSYDEQLGVSVLEIDNVVLPDKTEDLSTVKVFYKLPVNLEDLYNGIDHITLKLRFKASSSELSNYSPDYYENKNVNHFVKIKNLYVYGIELVDAVEQINSYERKYYISIGRHGDFPPHGYESTGSLLYKLPNDNSTVYQMDSLYGVVGMPNSNGEYVTMNKVRGRIIKKCHPDKEPVNGPKDPHYYEDEQKKIHDAIALSGNTTCIMKSYPPPGFEDKLAELSISFPKWVCVLENTLVRPLAPINKFSTYSPCGHHFIYDFENIRHEVCVLCGHGFPVPCGWEDIYDRKFERACKFNGSNYSVVPNWAVVAYYQGIANVLIRPFEYFVKPATEFYANVATNLKSWSGDVKLELYPNTISLY